MQRLQAIGTETATGKVKDLFNGVQAKLGSVPTMFRTMGNSAAVLEGYLNLNGALAGGSLGARLGELIALTVANANGCEYCNAAHSFIGEKMVRIDSAALANAREGKST
ncbi:carboxymuconolactone decarboxylase family protein [Puia sp. P3]|uniref:carboxymuconolactone decarboxylase family protein n=1 Tax=Puia sp. P3 TaxID=3423952 RepID=UPI003D66AC4F